MLLVVGKAALFCVAGITDVAGVINIGATESGVIDCGVSGNTVIGSGVAALMT